MRAGLPQVLVAQWAGSNSPQQTNHLAYESKTGAFIFASEGMAALRTRDHRDFIAVAKEAGYLATDFEPARPPGYETELDTFSALIDSHFPLLMIEDAAAGREGFVSAEKSEEGWRLTFRYVGSDRSVGKNSKLAQFNPMRTVTLDVAPDGFLLRKAREGIDVQEFARPTPMPDYRRYVSDSWSWKVASVSADVSSNWKFDLGEAAKILEKIQSLAGRTVLVDKTGEAKSVQGVPTTAVTVGQEEVPNIEGKAPAWRTPVVATGAILIIVGIAAAIRRRSEGGGSGVGV